MASSRVQVIKNNYLICTFFVAFVLAATASAAGVPNEIVLNAFIRQQQQSQKQYQQQQQELLQQQEVQPWADGTYYKPETNINRNAGVLSFDKNFKYLNDNDEDDKSEIKEQEKNFNLDDEDSFFEISPSIGQTTGLTIDENGNLVLFHRSLRSWDEYSFTDDNKFNKTLGLIVNSTIAILNSNTGKLLAEYGSNQFYMPHGLTIDSNGSYWLTDVGSHQVFKLDKNFNVMMKLGEELVPGDDEKHFCKPTDVAVAKNGDFFIADGYCNSRIMKFNKDGKFVTSFGAPNSQNPPKVGEFLIPHSLTLIEDLNLLCVADRENKRIQCFAAGLNEGSYFHPRAFIPTGTFYTKAENIGRVVAIREKQHFLVGVTNNDETGQDEPQVFVMDMNTGRANTFAKGLESAHALALSKNGEIYISQINPNQIVKFTISD